MNARFVILYLIGFLHGYLAALLIKEESFHILSDLFHKYICFITDLSNHSLVLSEETEQPWKVVMHQILRRKGQVLFFRRFSSAHSSSSEPGLHFENHRIEDVNSKKASF